MKNFLRLFFSAEGQGNIGYDDAPTTVPASPLLSADDGLSTDAATSTIAQLGQTVGRAGDPAVLLEDREIPMATHTIWFGHLLPATNVVGISDDNGITAFNNSGNGYQVQWVIGPDSSSFNLHSNGGDVVQTFNTTEEMRIDSLLANPVFAFNRPVVGNGLGSSIRTTINVLDTFQDTDTTVLVNDSLGNAQINIDPTLIPNQFGYVKKLGSTVNTVTLNALSGLIFGSGTSAATYVFSVPGESIEFQSDGVNLYIL